MYVIVYVHLYVCTLATVPYICMYVHLCLMYTYVMFVYIYGKKKKENKHTTFLILIFHRFKIYIKNYFFSFKYKIFTSQFENKKKNF